MLSRFPLQHRISPTALNISYPLFQDRIKNDEAAYFVSLHPAELVEVYLGYRMTDDTKAETIRLAKNLNPEMKIFAALAKRKYALEFDPIACP